VVCRGIDDHGPRLSRFAASATRRSGLPGAPSVRSLAGRSPETAWVAVRTVRRCPSVRFLTLIPRFPGDRRAPEAESRGSGSVWRPGAPSARVAGRPLAGPPPSGRQRLVQSRGPYGPVCQVPPRLGSQGDRSPVPRRAGDSVCMAVPGLRRRPPGGPEPRSPIERRTTSDAGSHRALWRLPGDRVQVGTRRTSTQEWRKLKQRARRPAARAPAPSAGARADRRSASDRAAAESRRRRRHRSVASAIAKERGGHPWTRS